MTPPSRRAFATRAVHHPTVAPPLPPLATPIYQTSTYCSTDTATLAELAQSVQPSSFYTRYGNPTVEVWERVVADLEEGERGLAFASGMAAISCILSGLLEPGDHVVAGSALYTATKLFMTRELPRAGIQVDFVDATRPESFAEAMRETTRMFYVETPANPTLELTDLAAVCQIARDRPIVTVVDNTFASPCNQRPLTQGAQVVVHSGTKYLGGHSDVLGGCAVCDAATAERLWQKRTLYGGSLDPLAAYLLLRGTKTLAVRVERQNQNALAVARALSAHPAVARVLYPGLPDHPQHALACRQMSGFGGMLSFELTGGRAAGARFVEATRIARLAVSLGGVETLVEHPASMSHVLLGDDELRRAGIPPGLIRMSVGIEDAADLIADLHQALAGQIDT